MDLTAHTVASLCGKFLNFYRVCHTQSLAPVWINILTNYSHLLNILLFRVSILSYDSDLASHIVAFFCRNCCFLISNPLIRVSTNFIYCATWCFFLYNIIYIPTWCFFFSSSSILKFHSFLTKLSNVPIFNYIFTDAFVCGSNSYLVTSFIFLGTAITITFSKVLSFIWVKLKIIVLEYWNYKLCS